MRHTPNWTTTTYREVEYESPGRDLRIYDHDAEFGVDLEWSPAEYEESWGATVQVRRDATSVESVTLISIKVGGRSRSREYLAELIGESEVSEIEDWHSDDIDPRDLAE